jgi:hypothetical protein
METALMSNIGRKVALAAVAFATVGSTAFGGVALANGGWGGDDQDARGGDATGGSVTGNCVSALNNVLGIGLLGVSDNDNANCIAGPARGGDAVNLD